MSIFKRCILVFVAFFSIIEATHASTITETIDFTASDFTSNPSGATPSVDPVSGSFTLTFDPTLIYPTTSTGITLNNLSVSSNFSPIGFSTDGTGDLRIGNVIGSAIGNSVDVNTFAFDIAGIGSVDP